MAEVAVPLRLGRPSTCEDLLIRPCPSPASLGSSYGSYPVPGRAGHGQFAEREHRSLLNEITRPAAGDLGHPCESVELSSVRSEVLVATRYRRTSLALQKPGAELSATALC